MHEQGKGVPRDFHQAAKLYRQAAERGNEDAMIRMGQYCLLGLGLVISRSLLLFNLLKHTIDISFVTHISLN